MSDRDDDDRNNEFPNWSRVRTLESGLDLDILQRAGMYAVPQPVNGPLVGVDVFVTVLSANINGVQRIVQVVNEAVNGRSYTRVRTDNGWSAWNWDNPTSQTGQLSGSLVLYVRPDGNDLNTGLANTPAGALRTVTAAVAKMKSYDLNRKPVTINIAAADYSNEPTIVIDDLKNPFASSFSFGVRLIGSSFDINTAPNYKLPYVHVKSNNTGALVELVGLSMPFVTYTNALGSVNMCEFTGSQAIEVIGDGYVSSSSCNHAPAVPAGCQFFAKAQGGSILLANATLVGNPTYAQGVLVVSNVGFAARTAEIILATGITGTATGKQYNFSGSSNVRLSATSGSLIASPTTDTDLFVGIPGTQPPYASETIADMTYSGTIQGAITARDYDLLFELPCGYRIESFGARCKTGSATCQLRVAGNGVSQGVAVGSTFNAAGGGLTYAANVNNKCGGRTPGFTMTVSGSPTGTDLHWELRLRKVFEHAAN